MVSLATDHKCLVSLATDHKYVVSLATDHKLVVSLATDHTFVVLLQQMTNLWFHSNRSQISGLFASRSQICGSQISGFSLIQGLNDAVLFHVVVNN